MPLFLLSDKQTGEKNIMCQLPDPNVRRLLLKSQAQLKGQAFKLSSKCSKVSLDNYLIVVVVYIAFFFTFGTVANLELVPDRL